MKNFLKYFWITLLAAAIAISPSFVFGTIEGGRPLEIRVEDVLIALFCFFWILNIMAEKKTALKKPPLFLPIMAWLGVGAISVLSNIILGNIGVSRAFFFFLKEVEFFVIYFFVASRINKTETAKYVVNVWIALGAANALWIIYELISGSTLTYYYGPTAFSEPGAPFPSGGFFLVLFLFLLNVFLFYYLYLPLVLWKKIFIGVATSLPLIGLLSSGSRTSFYALILSLLAVFFLYMVKRGSMKSALKLCFFAIIVIAIAWQLLPFIPGSDRFIRKENIGEFQVLSRGSRLTLWGIQITGMLKNPSHLLFGFGKSYILEEEQPHNQYLQNLVDVGIVGSIIFFVIIGSIIKKSLRHFIHQKDPFIVGISAGLLAITLAMLIASMAAEAFRVVKPSEIYWFLIAIGMAVLTQEEKFVEISQTSRDRHAL